MNKTVKLWRTLKDNGCDATTDPLIIKNIVFTNSLLYISVTAYTIFFISVLASCILSTNILFFSTVTVFLGFFLVFFLMKQKKILLAKSILLLLIYLAIFFYDLNLGESLGVYFYYFAFFFATVNVFSWDKEKILLIVFLCIPAILFFFTEFYNLKIGKTKLHQDISSLSIYIFNSLMTFFIIALNALLIIKENLITQQSLKHSKLNAQLLIDNTQGYIWSIDNDNKLIAFSNSYKEIIKSHYNIDCFEGLNMKLILDLPNNPVGINEVYNKALSGKAVFSEYFSNGNYFEIQASPLYNIEGVQTGATFHSRLITQKKDREKELQQSKINLETLIDTVGNSTWSLNKQYKIIVANKMYINDMKRIFNVDVNPGFDVSTLFSYPNYPQDWIKQYETVFSGTPISLDYTFNNDSFELNAVPIKNISNEVMGAVFFSRNISDRKKIETELTQAKVNAEEATLAKAQFLSNMSHELRTPLNGIIGLTNLLLSEQYLPSQTQHLEVLKYSSDHMLLLINDVLDFNKIEAGKVVLENNGFNLLEIINQMKLFFSWEASGKGLQFEVNISDALNRLIYGDVTRLRQVLTNLISNAIKFTEKGKVIFSVDIIEKIEEDSCKLRFAVIDTGIGIEPDKLSQIFESFRQADPSTIRKYGGSGLGLTISKKLIELMGTQLEVKSTINKGSTFWFDLIVKCSYEKQTLAIQKDINQLTNLKGIHILVAEDNPVNMLVVCKMLEKWNVHVSKAKNGKEAFMLAQKHTYDLILMDLQMPEMDGFTATAHIREASLTMPIIALTATTDDSMIKNVIEKGMNGLVQKPFIPEELHRIIGNTLNVF
jgi:signal transduction histidine kinase/CheY-like chemotaxis protein